MADMKEIHEFAVNWCDKFRDQKMTINNAVRLLRIDTTKKVRPHLAQQPGMNL